MTGEHRRHDGSSPGLVAVLGMLAVAFAVGVVGVWWLLDTTSSAPSPAAPGAASGPTVPPQPEVIPDAGGYAPWARNSDGSPVRWNPCEPIRWVVNLDGAPPGAELDLSRAVAEVSAATGLRFRSLGTTDEPPRRARPPYQPDRYGEERWAPLLVAWASPSATDVPLLDSDRGVSIPVAVGDGDRDVFVSGQIVLNPDRPLLGGFGDRATSWGATILHELGHIVGLDHVGDPLQLMYTFPGRGPARFAAGDLRGLSQLGTGGCVEVPDPADVDVTYVDDFDR